MSMSESIDLGGLVVTALVGLVGSGVTGALVLWKTQSLVDLRLTMVANDVERLKVCLDEQRDELVALRVRVASILKPEA